MALVLWALVVVLAIWAVADIWARRQPQKVEHYWRRGHNPRRMRLPVTAGPGPLTTDEDTSEILKVPPSEDEVSTDTAHRIISWSDKEPTPLRDIFPPPYGPPRRD